MRTDTATFSNRVFKMTRALGINSVRSKRLARQIAGAIQYGSYTDSSLVGRETIASLELKLHIRSECFHLVEVFVDGDLFINISSEDRILVNTTPTARQLEIRDLLGDMLPAIYDALGNEDKALVATLNARYDALKAESLAINPWVDGSILDPDAAMFYSDRHKEEFGFRPRGYTTLGDMNAYLEQFRVAANDDMPTASAA